MDRVPDAVGTAARPRLRGVRRVVLPFLLLLVTLAGCASRDRSPGIRAFQRGNFDVARQQFEAGLIEAPEDEALDRNALGLAELASGNVEAAHRQFLEAFHDLDDLTASTGETVAAVVGTSRARRWKGDPHERCMNAYYLGICSWLLDDVDNAAAAFKAGILRDADSAEGAARSDFALLHLLSGMAERTARHEDRGRDALRAAAGLLPGTPFADPDSTADANVLVVIDRGFGPVRVPTGPEGAWVAFRGSRGRGRASVLYEGAKELARGTPAVDVQWQAMTRGDKVLDGVNKGKAVVKSVAEVAGVYRLGTARNDSDAAVGAGLLLTSLLISSEADLRTWETLPAEVQVLAVRLPEGEHELNVHFEGSQGSTASGPFRVRVRPGRLSLVWTSDVWNAGARVQRAARVDTEIPVSSGSAQGDRP